MLTPHIPTYIHTCTRTYNTEKHNRFNSHC